MFMISKRRLEKIIELSFKENESILKAFANAKSIKKIV